MNPDRRFSIEKGIKTLSTITQNTGVSGLWRGNGAAMWRVMPHSAIVFATFDRYERVIKVARSGHKDDVASRFLAGAAAGATATMVRLGAYCHPAPRP